MVSLCVLQAIQNDERACSFENQLIAYQGEHSHSNQEVICKKEKKKKRIWLCLLSIHVNLHNMSIKVLTSQLAYIGEMKRRKTSSVCNNNSQVRGEGLGRCQQQDGVERVG